MVDWRELVLEGRFNEAEPLMLADTEKRDGYGGETIVTGGVLRGLGQPSPLRSRGGKAILAIARLLGTLRFLVNQRRRGNCEDDGCEPDLLKKIEDLRC